MWPLATILCTLYVNMMVDWRSFRVREWPRKCDRGGCERGNPVLKVTPACSAASVAMLQGEIY